VVIEVLIADDHAAVRAGLVALLRLEPGLVPVAAATTGAEAVERARTRRPDVALLDYHLPDMDGLAVCSRIRALDDAPQVVIYSAFADERLALPATLLGAQAILSKEASTEALFDTLRTAAASRSEPSVAPSLLATARESIPLDDMPVLGMLADGTPVTEIAEVLSVSVAEIELRRESIINRLKAGVDGRLAYAGGASAAQSTEA